MSKVDSTTPPNGVQQTPVYFDLDFREVSKIKENKMHLAVKINEYLSWIDLRLAYSRNVNVSSYFKSSRIDLSPFKNQVWHPKLSYTE